MEITDKEEVEVIDGRWICPRCKMLNNVSDTENPGWTVHCSGCGDEFETDEAD